MANVETLTAHARDGRPVATVDIRSDSRHFTVWTLDETPRPLGTISAPHPGWPIKQKDWQAHATDGRQIPGLVVGPRGALRKIARTALDLGSLIILPALETNE